MEAEFFRKSFRLRQKKSNYNYGISYKFRDYGNIDLSYIKGDTLNLSFSVGFSSKKPLRKKKKFEPTLVNSDYQQDPKNEFYRDLLENLNANKLYLQTADLDDKNLSLTIDSLEFVNPIQYSSRAAFIAEKVLEFNKVNVDNIDVGLITRGVKINEIKAIEHLIFKMKKYSK